MPALTGEGFAHIGLTHDFIVDVGVFQGTRWLYEAFPAAPFVLVEPYPVPALLPRNVVANYTVAAGDGEGRGRYQDDRAVRQVLVDDTGDVPIKPLSEILEPHPGRFGLKINAEGSDAAVIRGLGDRRKDVAWLHVEVALRQNLFAGSTAADLFAAMGQDFLPYLWFDCPWPHWEYCSALFLPRDHKLLVLS